MLEPMHTLGALANLYSENAPKERPQKVQKAQKPEIQFTHRLMATLHGE
jgi:hypothetical protein